MYCSNCGTKIEDGAKFCHNCGTPVVSNTAPAEAQAPVRAPETEVPASAFGIPVPAQADDIEVTPVPVPSFAVPEVTPGDIVLPEPPVFDMPESVTSPGVQSVYTDPGTALMPEVTAHPDAQTFPANDYDRRPQTEAPVPQVEAKPLYAQVPQPQTPQAEPQSAPQPVYQQVPQQPQPAAQPAQPSQPVMQTYAFGAAAPGTQSSDAGQAAPPAAPAVPAPPVKAKKKGGAGRAIAIFAVLALIAVGWWFFMGPGKKEKPPVINGPEDVQDYVLGKQAFDSGEYEAAEMYLESAYEILPDSPDIEYYLFETYRARALEFLNAHDYYEAEPRIYKLVEISNEDLSALIPQFYSQWLQEIVLGTAEGDLDYIAEKGGDYLSEADWEIINNFVPGSTPSPTSAKTYDDVALILANAVDNNDWFTACSCTYVYDFIIIPAITDSQNGYVTTMVSGYDYEFVRFYFSADDDIVYAYYGDLDENGDRSGVGFITATMDPEGDAYLYYYLSMWSGDKPNGKFKEIVRSGEEFSEYETYSGSTVNGIYEGEVEWERGGTPFLCTYDSGVPRVIRVDENGYYVIAEATDGSDRYLYLDEEPGPDYMAGLELVD